MTQKSQQKLKVKPSLLSSLSWLGIAAGLLAVFSGEQVQGLLLVVIGLALRIERNLTSTRNASFPEIHTEQISRQDNALPFQSQPSNPEDWKGLDLKTPYLEKNYGWDSISLNKATQKYQRSICFGGPPVRHEIWEYEIKDAQIVFQRLQDSWSDELHVDHIYEIANGCVQLATIRRKNEEHEEWSKSSSFQLPLPYDDETLASLRARTTWHELNGILRYFILKEHGYLLVSLDRVIKSLNEVEAVLTKLGCVDDEHGALVLPAGSSDEVRERYWEILSAKSLREKFKLRSFQDWRDRTFIRALVRRSTDV